MRSGIEGALEKISKARTIDYQNKLLTTSGLTLASFGVYMSSTHQQPFPLAGCLVVATLLGANYLIKRHNVKNAIRRASLEVDHYRDISEEVTPPDSVERNNIGRRLKKAIGAAKYMRNPQLVHNLFHLADRWEIPPEQLRTQKSRGLFGRKGPGLEGPDPTR